MIHKTQHKKHNGLAERTSLTNQRELMCPDGLVLTVKVLMLKCNGISHCQIVNKIIKLSGSRD